MSVPLLDPRLELPELQGDLRDAFERVLSSGQYILGPEVEALERELAALCGTAHALGVSNGTDALLLALMAQDIGAGDEVICPSYSFFATAGSIWRCGARPVFVDSCPGCFNLLPSAVEAAITPRTRAIMPVHLFGQCAHMAPLLALARASGLVVIEDAAQALGALHHDQPAGSMGRVGCFSFFPSKNLGALGDAGLVTVDEPVLWQRIKSLRVHGASRRYHHSQVGGNFRMDALQAAFLRAKLPRLPAAVARRRRHAALYDEMFAATGRASVGACLCASAAAGGRGPLGGACLTLPANTTGEHVYNQYVVRLATPQLRERVRHRLMARDIGCAVYYPVPLHRQACFAELPQAGAALPHADHAAQTTLALPIYHHLSEAQIAQVADEVLRALSHTGQAIPQPA